MSVLCILYVYSIQRILWPICQDDQVKTCVQCMCTLSMENRPGSGDVVSVYSVYIQYTIDTVANLPER